VLLAINQGDVLVTGTWSASLLWKVPLTYAVPFMVATRGVEDDARRTGGSGSPARRVSQKARAALKYMSGVGAEPSPPSEGPSSEAKVM
jgi:hypothetical protein